MAQFRLGENYKILPVLAPVDGAASAGVSAFVDMDMIHWLSFIIPFGNMTSDDSDVVAIKVRCSTEDTSATTEPMEIDFTYRITSAVGTDSVGTVTAGTSDGIGTSDDGLNAANLDNKILILSVDASAVAAKAATSGGNRWVSFSYAPTGPITLLGALAIGEPRYPGTSQPSST
jgi:hypothetical protein